MNVKIFGAPALFVSVCLSAIRLSACGDYFPNSLLNGGDEAVLAVPVAYFEVELGRMRLGTNAFVAITTTNSYAEDSANAELDDLRTDLERSGEAASAIETVVKEHQLERSRLQGYVDGMEQWKELAPMVWDDKSNNYVAKPTGPAPEFPDAKVASGLPEEFSNYFAGAVIWANPAITNKDSAVGAWERVLNLPPRERRFKSTWASFMLGKYWIDKDPQKAIGYFQQTRQLATNGFADSCGLAAASFGLEALAQLRRTNYEQAILLYREQQKTGDPSAMMSLEFTAARALATNNPALLKQLAADPFTQRVITAYLISCEPREYKKDQAADWLDAVEAAGVRDADSAEELALAAYQAGEWDTAQRWVDRAPTSSVSQWLEAKLLLRAGKIEQAGALLAKVVKLMASEDGVTNQLKDDLGVPHYEPAIFIYATNQVCGELGVFRLSQRDYVESLDALLRSGFWMDAAYVAERILTADELKAYVDQDWPDVPPADRGQAVPSDGTDARNDIRYLLARRLARLGRSEEARAYYPEQLRQHLDALVEERKIGHDESVPQKERAEALFGEAMITSTNGMELLGTELAPDWFFYNGEFDDGITAECRTNNAKLFVPSADELQRYAQNDVEPEARYHYLYLAADLAVDAARFMPDNSDETARVLCMAGSWIKYLDPPKADPIYKMLVLRCRHTQIGRQADLMRWFPVMDDSGNPIPYRPRAKANWAIFQNRFGISTDPGYFYYIGTIHMLDRQNGWAQSVASLVTTKEPVFEQNAILRTTDGGASWNAVLCASPEHNIAISAYDKETAWVTANYDDSTNVFVFQTINGGRSWGSKELSVPYSIQGSEVVFPLPDQNAEQSPAPENAYPPPVYDSSEIPDRERLFVIPDHGMNSMPGYLYGFDGFYDWRLINSTEKSNWIDSEGGEPGFADRHPYLTCGGRIAFQDATNGWLLGQLTTTSRPFLFFTRDGGANWQEQKFSMPPTLHEDGRIEPSALPRFFGTNGIVEMCFVPKDDESTNFYEVIYDTHDFGQTWQPTAPIRFMGTSSFVSSQTGWIWSPEPQDSNSTAPARGILYRTDDGGQTWKAISKSLEDYLMHGENVVQLDFVDDEYGWAVAQDWRNKTQLLKTTDGGETWTALN